MYRYLATESFLTRVLNLDPQGRIDLAMLVLAPSGRVLSFVSTPVILSRNEAAGHRCNADKRICFPKSGDSIVCHAYYTELCSRLIY